MLVESREPCMTFVVLPLNYARMLPARLVVGEGWITIYQEFAFSWLQTLLG